MTTASEVRALLEIPADATSVVVLGMDAHMDWDWRETFPQYLVTNPQSDQAPVEEIVKSAWALMVEHPPEPQAPYMYSVCETGYLRAVIEKYPELADQFEQHDLARQLNIEGGGITSPDNLLPHGEAFVRCYLVGRNWLRERLGLSSTFAYLPDDFGHDSQLPVALEAMGLTGVSFSRLPGSWGSNTGQLHSTNSLYHTLFGQQSAWGTPSPQRWGADIIWDADDGSSVMAHVFIAPYYEGASIAGSDDIKRYVQNNHGSSAAPYTYVPCGADFACPNPALLQYATEYNDGAKATDPYCVVGTLEQFFTLVSEWNAEHDALKHHRMDPTPYWTGFYASRPENKILHQAAVRALLGAEVFGAIGAVLHAGAPNPTGGQKATHEEVASGIDAGWEAVVPSTHHDYITGTATDAVYNTEQVPLLSEALTVANATRATAVGSIAGQVRVADSGGPSTPVVVLNSLGARRGLASIESTHGQAFLSVEDGQGPSMPVQRAADGTWLFTAQAPALGYATYRLCSAKPSATVEGAASVTVAFAGDSVTMSNSSLTVELSKASGWAITSLRPIEDGQAGASIVASGSPANALGFYEDKGSIYNFGNEAGGASGFAPATTGTFDSTALTVAEDGPLRVRVEAGTTWTDGAGSTADYNMVYELIAGEPSIGVTITGAVPLPADPAKGGIPYSVAVRFPFATGGTDVTVDGVFRGTPYHWTSAPLTPVNPSWDGPTFQATHNFVVPTHAQTPLAAIYHSDIPAWAVDDGALIGCILRNTPNVAPWPAESPARGADGTDFGVHTHRYSIRVPNGLELPPASGQASEEATAAATRFETAYVNTPSSSLDESPISLPETFSLASVKGGAALVTVAKLGTNDPHALILRLYQPSNAAQTVSVDLSGYVRATGIENPVVVPVTALEEPIQGATALVVTSGIVSVPMPRALITLQVTPSASR